MKLPSLFNLVANRMTHTSSYFCAPDTLRDLRGSDRAGDQTGGSPERNPGSYWTAGAANNQSANHHTVHHHNNHQRQRQQWSSHNQTLIMYGGELHVSGTHSQTEPACRPQQLLRTNELTHSHMHMDPHQWLEGKDGWWELSQSDARTSPMIAFWWQVELGLFIMHSPCWHFSTTQGSCFRKVLYMYNCLFLLFDALIVCKTINGWLKRQIHKRHLMNTTSCRLWLQLLPQKNFWSLLYKIFWLHFCSVGGSWDVVDSVMSVMKICGHSELERRCNNDQHSFMCL